MERLGAGKDKVRYGIEGHVTTYAPDSIKGNRSGSLPALTLGCVRRRRPGALAARPPR